MIRAMNKKGFEMSFAWLFAIIVGMVILFFAIFAVTKIMKTEEGILDVRTSKEFQILLNPLETSFESAIATSITFPVETQIINVCDNRSSLPFGSQKIKINQKSFGKFTKTDLDVKGFPNKYILTEKIIQGKKFYLFSKPFEFPFKVANLIYMVPSEKHYCFGEMNEDDLDNIKDELEDLNKGNFYFEDDGKVHPENCIEICFNGNCDGIEVNYQEGKGYVTKNGKTMDVIGDTLMLGAIFSEKEIYDCEVQRLMLRVGSLAKLYKEKINFVSRANCNSNLGSQLDSLFEKTQNYNGDLTEINNALVEPIREIHKEADCKLW